MLDGPLTGAHRQKLSTLIWVGWAGVEPFTELFNCGTAFGAADGPADGP